MRSLDSVVLLRVAEGNLSMPRTSMHRKGSLKQDQQTMFWYAYIDLYDMYLILYIHMFYYCLLHFTILERLISPDETCGDHGGAVTIL